MSIEQIRRIASFAELYQRDFLSKYDQTLLKTNSWEALNFFFERAFMRGRKDILSGVFLGKAIEVLRKYSLNTILINRKLAELIKSSDWQNDLKQKLYTGGVNNRYDREMIISTLRYICGINEDNNLVMHSINKIEEKSLKELYYELDTIFGIGPKLDSFFLRDLICLYKLEEHIEFDDFSFVQPIDTWVEKAIEKLAIAHSIESLDAKREAIIRACKEADVHPISFNQGCWYSGYHKKFDDVFK